MTLVGKERGKGVKHKPYSIMHVKTILCVQVHSKLSTYDRVWATVGLVIALLLAVKTFSQLSS